MGLLDKRKAEVDTHRETKRDQWLVMHLPRLATEIYFVFLSTSTDFFNLCFACRVFAVVPGMSQIWVDEIITHPQGSGHACPEKMAEERRGCVKDCP